MYIHFYDSPQVSCHAKMKKNLNATIVLTWVPTSESKLFLNTKSLLISFAYRKSLIVTVNHAWANVQFVVTYYSSLSTLKVIFMALPRLHCNFLGKVIY